MRGNTLIETLIYIALLSLLMVGVFSSIHMILYTEGRVEEQDEALLLKNYQDYGE